MKKTFAILLFLQISAYGQTQTPNITIPTETIEIEYTNGRLIFNICKKDQKVTFKEDQEYFWYNEYSNVKSTKGGAGGNLLHGKYQFFDENGNLNNESNYYLGLKDGTAKTWDDDGKITSTYKYIKGKLFYSKFKAENSEEVIEWNGPILEVGSVKKIYDKYNTLIQSEEILIDLNVKVTEFFFNGRVKRKFTTALFDYKTGEYLEYHENGKIKLSGQYEANWKVGEWKWYTKEGIADGIEKYRINRKHTPDKKLISEGGEFFDVNSNEWVRNGLWIWYKENGEDWLLTKEYEYGLEVDKQK